MHIKMIQIVLKTQPLHIKNKTYAIDFQKILNPNLVSVHNLSFVNIKKNLLTIKLFANLVKSKNKTLGFMETKDDNQNARWDYAKRKKTNFLFNYFR